MVNTTTTQLTTILYRDQEWPEKTVSVIRGLTLDETWQYFDDDDATALRQVY